MAGPLINMLQGLRQRRMRRRGGWGGGDSPSMRNLINPLDSQDMSDRSQGVDISSAMPSTKLETRVQPRESAKPDFLPIQPGAEAAVRDQLLPQSQAPSETPSPFMNAAGSNAAPSPVKGAQCGPEGCQVGPSAGLDPSRYGITLEPGQTLVRVGPEVSGATASAGPAQAPQASAAPSVAGGMGQQQSATPLDAWQGFMSVAAQNPQEANWAEASRAALDVARDFYRKFESAATPTEKAIMHGQFTYWAKESSNAYKAHLLAENLKPRQRMAEQAMNRGSLKSQFEDTFSFLSDQTTNADADTRAAIYANKLRTSQGLEALPPEQIASDSGYQTARQISNAADIAHSAVLTASANSDLYPWGTPESRDAGEERAFNEAVAFYGAMPWRDAQKQIKKNFIPAYVRSLESLNEARAESGRLSRQKIVELANGAAEDLWSELYHAQNKGEDQPPRAAPQPEQQPAPQRQAGPQPAAQGGGWRDFFFE